MNVRVRRHDNDKPLIEYLDSRLFSDEERVDNVETSAWWVGWDEDRPGAYAGARLVPGTKFVFMSRAGVLPEARGGGLQKRLLRLRLRWAKAQGATAAITYTHPHNVISANNLITCGFRMYTPEWAWVGKEFLYWRKELP